MLALLDILPMDGEQLTKLSQRDNKTLSKAVKKLSKGTQVDVPVVNGVASDLMAKWMALLGGVSSGGGAREEVVCARPRRPPKRRVSRVLAPLGPQLSPEGLTEACCLIHKAEDDQTIEEIADLYHKALGSTKQGLINLLLYLNKNFDGLTRKARLLPDTDIRVPKSAKASPPSLPRPRLALTRRRRPPQLANRLMNGLRLPKEKYPRMGEQAAAKLAAKRKAEEAAVKKRAEEKERAGAKRRAEEAAARVGRAVAAGFAPLLTRRRRSRHQRRHDPSRSERRQPPRSAACGRLPCACAGPHRTAPARRSPRPWR